MGHSITLEEWIVVAKIRTNTNTAARVPKPPRAAYLVEELQRLVEAVGCGIFEQHLAVFEQRRREKHHLCATTSVRTHTHTPCIRGGGRVDCLVQPTQQNVTAHKWGAKRAYSLNPGPREKDIFFNDTAKALRQENAGAISLRFLFDTGTHSTVVGSPNKPHLLDQNTIFFI